MDYVGIHLRRRSDAAKRIVPHFVDYTTLVFAKLAGSYLLHLATKFAGDLARHRRFRITFFNGSIVDDDVTIGRSIPYEPGNHQALAAACRELDEAIGPHAVASMKFYTNTWNKPRVDVIFEAAPPLKYVEDVLLYGTEGSTNVVDPEGFISNFIQMKSLCLCLEKDVFPQFKWTFLTRSPHANFDSSNSPDVYVGIRIQSIPPKGSPAAPHFPVYEAERHWTSTSQKSAFPQHSPLKKSGREVTFRMSTQDDGELVLDESDYTLDLNGNATRYASKKSSIVVEVNGRSVTVQSTADVPQEERRRK